MINELATNMIKIFIVLLNVTPSIILNKETIIQGGVTADKTEKKATITTEIKGIANIANKWNKAIGIAITLIIFLQ